MTDFLAAAVQLTSSQDPEANFTAAEEQIDLAARRGAELVGLPENFAFMGDDSRRLELAPTLAEQCSRFLVTMARRYQVTLLGGGFPVPVGDGQRTLNRAELVDRDGQLLARYDKIHLFDVGVPDSAEAYRESATFMAGTPAPQVIDTPFGRLGLTVCYDLRFPELYRALAADGAEIIVAPSAFTHTTGSAHWHVLTRARAIENLATIVAPNQAGHHANGRQTYGHSLIVDSWGQIKAEARSDANEVVVARIDRSRVEKLRDGFPCLSHRRLF